MKKKAVISDWNGTLFGPSTDLYLNRTIGYAIANDIINALKALRLWRIPDLISLLRARAKLKKTNTLYEQEKVSLHKVYDEFNSLVLNGRQSRFIHEAIVLHTAKYADQVELHTLRAIRKARQEGFITGILSVSLKESIEQLLIKTGFNDVFDSDNIFANTVEFDHDRINKITLDIFGKKAECLENIFFRERGLNPKTTYYIGDSEDDEPIAVLLPPGNFIVSLLAEDDYRQRLSKEHGAFTPKNEFEITQHLKLNC